MRARNCGVSLLGLLVAKTVIGRLSRGRNNGVRLHSASRAVPGGAGVEVSKADGAVDQRAQSEHSNSNRRPRIGSGSRGLILLLQGGALLLVLQLLVLGSFSIWWSARQPVEGQPFAGQPYLQLLTTFTGVAMVLWSMVALSVVWNILAFGAGSAASLSRSSAVAHTEAPQRPGPKGAPAPFVDLSGRWVKDRDASSSMEDALSAMQLGGLVRTAVKLVRGLEIHHTREHFHYGVFSAIPILKIWERYQLNGEPARFKRRDLRRGKHVGSCEPHDKGVVVKVRWDEPLGGHGEDVFRLISPTELHVLSHLILDNRPDRTVRFTAVYRKR